MSQIKGRSLQEARRFFVSAPKQFTANQTVTQLIAGLPPGVGPARILSVSVMGSAVPADADGNMQLNVKVQDISEGAADVLVNAQDLKALITAAKRMFACTLAAEGSEKEFTIDPTDVLFIELVNSSAVIDTNADIVVVIEYVPLKQAFDKNVRHRGSY